MRKPLMIDLFSGLGGWAEGFLATGWRVIAFDIVDMYRQTGFPRHPELELVLQDVLTLHGAQFRDADLLLCSPPCQSYSWLAMPWSRSRSEHSQAAKALRKKWETEGPDNVLWDACFRLQREASEAAGRHIPMVLENVRGAQEWCGRAKWHHGSFYLWGDVPALMPLATRIRKSPSPAVGRDWSQREVPRLNDGAEGGRNRAAHEWDDGQKAGRNGSWFRERNGEPQPGIPHEERGMKAGGDWFASGADCSPQRRCGSRSDARKAASAKIARIPPAISEHFAEVFRPSANETRLRIKGEPIVRRQEPNTDGENRTYLSDSCCEGPHANLRADGAVSHPDMIHPG